MIWRGFNNKQHCCADVSRRQPPKNLSNDCRATAKAHSQQAIFEQIGLGCRNLKPEVTGRELCQRTVRFLLEKTAQAMRFLLRFQVQNNWPKHVNRNIGPRKIAIGFWGIWTLSVRKDCQGRIKATISEDDLLCVSLPGLAMLDAYCEKLLGRTSSGTYGNGSFPKSGDPP